MDKYFRYDAVRRRLRVGPLNDYIDTFSEKISDCGYANDTGQQQLRAIARLSRWMSLHDLRAQDLDEEAVTRFLQERRRQGLLRHIEPRTLASTWADCWPFRMSSCRAPRHQ